MTSHHIVFYYSIAHVLNIVQENNILGVKTWDAISKRQCQLEGYCSEKY